MVFERPQKRASQQSRLSSPRNVFQRQYLSEEEEQAFYNRPIHRAQFDCTQFFPDAPYTPPVQTKTEETVTKEGLREESSDNNSIIQQQSEERPNRTGLPDKLKTGVENLSGYSLDDVRVHYNSPKPAQLQALAYTQGTDIHVAPGQEQHLPHETWHVVQQMQGRVKPTTQMKGVQINDDQGLEREADVMGAKASSFSFTNSCVNFLSPQKQNPKYYAKRIMSNPLASSSLADSVRILQAFKLRDITDKAGHDRVIDLHFRYDDEIPENVNALQNEHLHITIKWTDQHNNMITRRYYYNNETQTWRWHPNQPYSQDIRGVVLAHVDDAIQWAEQQVAAAPVAAAAAPANIDLDDEKEFPKLK